MELSYPTVFSDAAAVPFPPAIAVMLLLHCLIGLIAARLAHRKGLDLGLWFVWGMIGGTAALITAMLQPPSQNR
ncbi:MAG: hypothetical protein IGR92_12325 [Leptolyngbyaceae cyanobacterium T60_A2020_046]|nr:hypothetical protein [Leptolyngbyaceae cyanobacterium T60_A2020_046]